MAEKKVVILGGGFGGLEAALELEKHLSRTPGFKVTLIDQNTFHLYHASLYKVAAGELTSRCILIPFHRIFARKKVEFINATVTGLDPEKKLIRTNAKDRIHYDKLIVALGADTEDFGIPGVAEYAIGLKSVTDAEKISREMARLSAVKTSPVKVVIGGGGFTGAELAGELAESVKRPLEITIVEAAPRLLGGLPEKISQSAARRLNLLGVRVLISTPIKEVRRQSVALASGRTVPYDLLIWTAGVRGSRFLDPQKFTLDKKRAVEVDRHLKARGHKDIYVIGDNAATGVPWTATKAKADARVAAQNISARILGQQERRTYPTFSPPFIIPIGRNWAIAKIGKIIFQGRTPAILKDLVLLRYLLGILPFRLALKIWWLGEREVLELRPPQPR